MYKIDELITEIYANETVEIPGDLTKEESDRIETKIWEKIQNHEMPSRRKKAKFLHKRIVVFLAATLILLLGLTVFAAKQQEWDIRLINFMGINESNALQMKGGEVIIDEVTTSTWTDYSEDKKGVEKQISIIGITSIGDKNSAYLRVDTDYILPKNFDEKTDYILPENQRIDITYENIFGQEELRTFGSTYTGVYENGKLGFLISIENCENLNKCKVRLNIENLYLYHDRVQHEETPDSESEELLAEGVWEKEWKFFYKSNTKTNRILKSIETIEGQIFLTKIEVSPISIRLEAIRNLGDRELPWTTDMLEEIHYKDGTKIKIKNKAIGGNLNGLFLEEYVNPYYLGEVLKPEEIDYFVICGQNVDI